ncbi:MAG: hypothetical protein AB1445_06540 [Bacillota bacterium]
MLQRPQIKTTLAVVFLLLFCWQHLWHAANLSRSYLYAGLRHYGWLMARRELLGWEALSGSNVDVRYRPGDYDLALMVLRTAEELYPQVWEETGHLPRERAIIAIYPDRASLRAQFGWQQGEDALGVYMAGIIRLLSPRAWIPGSSLQEMEQRFRSQGPLAHELSHFVLDYATAGNYPRWFSEGLAQLQEYRLTGYLWLEPGPPVEDNPYSFATVNKHLDRPNHQARAYRQSLLMVAHLEELTESTGGLAGIIAELARGMPARLAIERTTGMRFGQWELAWYAWVQDPGNPWRLMPATNSILQER